MDSPRSVDAYVGVGSNIEPEHHIPEALERLARHVELRGISTFYQTPPLGRPEQEPFLNGVVKIRTALEPQALKFTVLRGIEAELGRVRTDDRYAPRCIDLDVLLYGDRVVAREGIEIPDPDIRRRAFIAVPLLELAPSLVLPDTGESLAALPVAEPAAAMRPVPEFTQLLRARFAL